MWIAPSGARDRDRDRDLSHHNIRKINRAVIAA